MDRQLGIALRRARRLYAVPIKTAARELKVKATYLLNVELGKVHASDAIVDHYIEAYRIDATDIAKLRGSKSD